MGTSVAITITMEDDDLAAIQVAMMLNAAAAHLVASAAFDDVGDDVGKIDHRKLSRKSKTKWRHADALYCIKRDYLGDPLDALTPLMTEKQFVLHFRITRSRFQRLMNDIVSADIHFYKQAKAGDGSVGASLEAKLLLPLKCLAYGVPPHTFQDYFQMSQTLARDCCINFDRTVKLLYQSEYLRTPTEEDLKSLLKLHRHQHGTDGMFGSLDCMHTYWKNCPKGWQGSFQGKEKRPSIVLEAISDYHLWFWHASYGYAGTLNDLIILNMSPFLQSLVDGSFIEREKGVVPYEIAGSEFQYCFILVDGIYPPYSRFVRSIPEPIGERQKAFSGWQESCRKDVERAFGVLQAKFQVLARPMLQHNLDQIANKVASCMILHNMCVSDRVMGDVNARYNPGFSVADYKEVVEQAADLELVQGRGANEIDRTIGAQNLPVDAIAGFTDKQRWDDLKSVEHHNRLIEALMDQESSKRTAPN